MNDPFLLLLRMDAFNVRIYSLLNRGLPLQSTVHILDQRN